VRLSLAIAPEDAIPSSFVVFRDRLDVTIPKVARLGYDGVELALGRPEDVDAAEVAHLLADHRLGIPAISTGRVFAEQQAWLSSSDLAVRTRAATILKGLVDLAVEVGATRVNIGRVRGGIEEGEEPEVAIGRFIDGIRDVGDHAATTGIDLVIEPVNRYELNFVNSVLPDGIAIVDRVDHPNVKLMPDSFHMNIEDAHPEESILAAGSRVGYVQVADSNRWAPGQGHIDFRPFFEALSAIGYDDWVSVEMLPFPSPDLAAEQAVAFLRAWMPSPVA
jgi:sugar phosphate isomerase/epimerase